MHKLIKEQLERCRVAVLPTWDENTTHLVISKKTQLSVEDLQVDHYYIIELADYILNEPEGFTLSSNWNKGKKPQSKYLKCCVTKRMGKMIYVEAIGYNIEKQEDINDIFNGWLPSGGVTVKEEI